MGNKNIKKSVKREIIIKPQKMFLLRIDTSQVTDIEIDGIDHLDYPNFSDAFILNAKYKGREMTDEELEALNEDSDFVYEQVMEHLY